MPSDQNTTSTDYRALDAVEFIKAVGDDASKWASAFQQIVVESGLTIDESLMIGWFANAIECAANTRRWRLEKHQRENLDPGVGYTTAEGMRTLREVGESNPEPTPALVRLMRGEKP